MSTPIREELRHGGGLLHLTLDAPKGNVLDRAMIAAITDALERHAERPELRAIVFEGAGRHFSFGASVAEHRADQVESMLQGFHALFRRLAALSVPTAAVVRGQCLGGGLELAAWCTWLFASPDARLGLPEVRLAVFPPMGSLLLPWRVGAGAALDLCVTGRIVGADEALRMGLVSRVVDDPGEAFERHYSEHLAGSSPTALRFAERAARVDLHARLERDLYRLERLYLDELMHTPDANEGIAAFLEKRPPTWASGPPRTEDP